MKKLIVSSYGLLTTTNTEDTICLRFSSNSEASASELLENLEEISPRYYMNSGDVITRFKSTTTHSCVTRQREC